MNYKIAQFIITPGQRNNLVHEIYIAQPDANKEALAGKLFALIEIESKKADSLKIINFLINTLNYSYYQNEKMILRERVLSIKIEHIFESAIAKTNKRLAEFLQNEKIKLNPSLVNITIGVIYNDSLHFSNLGKNKALLLYKGKAEDGAKYKLTDITEQTTDKGEAKKSFQLIKLFSNIISGALPRGGYFIFSGETLSEYLSTKQIINIITTLPPASAAEQIKNTLSKINAYVPFLGIIIKNTAGMEMQKVKIKQLAASTRASIENLITTEEQTEKLLTPSGLINAKKWSSFFNNLVGWLNLEQTKKIGKKTFLLKDKIFSGKKISWFSFKKISNSLKNYLSILISLLAYIFKILSDKQRLSEFFKELISSVKNLFLKIKITILKIFFWYKNLNSINKILLSAFLICLIIFSSSLTWKNIKNKEVKNQVAINNLMAMIEQKQNQIDASLLYNNEEGAKKILEEVNKLIAELLPKNQTQKDQYNVLIAKHRVQIEKINRVIRADAIEIANLINLNPNAKPTNIILVQKKIFAADAEQKIIYSIDLKSKLTTSINLTDQNISKLDFPNIDTNNNISYFNTNSIIILDTKTEKLSTLKIDYSSKTQKIIDFKQYNGRYYLADAINGQIYRFNKNNSELTGAVGWLNSPEDLTNATSLFIDGDIYLLKNNGEVSQYSKGKKQEFSMSSVEPNFSQATKLTISIAQNYLYVFEPVGKRLVVFNKKGNFINQYTSDKFDNLKDFQIDETNKKIYFLSNATVYSIDLANTK
ncbi:hypothetical protein KKA93_00055 [Patescibacteria group bacterium]|nr:hypothetical protein [Patescibacteria group bacterium]MBU1663179.1 hypothetical protein [Patescibacteria group bacterium]MBU1933822.1 hypothetical protein [Patescibacteria group bacterium]MBU2007626.1 hypothetical protein [Patescibacteria group bacterium]MBU2233323.1 hypothetical protein [Patescibacteria group bacterium]